MAEITIEINGLDEILSKLSKSSKEIEAPIKQGLTAIAFDALESAQVLIQRGPKTGRIYKRKNVKHQASAPGEAPATDEGELVNSFQVNVLSFDKIDLINAAGHAFYLEYGTREIQPRPFMRPAALAAAERGIATLNAVVSAALKED